MLYSNPLSLLQRFPAVTEIPKSTRIWKDTRLLQAWLRVLDQQIIITASEQQKISTDTILSPLGSWEQILQILGVETLPPPYFCELI